MEVFFADSLTLMVMWAFVVASAVTCGGCLLFLGLLLQRVFFGEEEAD